MATPISLLLLLLLLLAVREMGWQCRQGRDMGRKIPPSPVATTTTLPHDTARLTLSLSRTISETFTLSYASEQRVQAGYRWFNNLMHQAGTHPCWPPYGA
jgi:hypothetical protein